MQRRTILSICALGAGASLIGAALWWPQSDEERIVSLLSELAGALRVSTADNPVFYAARLERSFSSFCTEPLRVRAHGLGQSGSYSLQELSLVLSHHLLRFSDVRVELSDIEVDVSLSTAQARASARVQSRRGEIPDEGVRRVVFDLEKMDGSWRVTQVTVPADEADS